MKRKAILITIFLIAIILLFPIPMRLKDGGSIEYKALLYKITKYHRLAPIDAESRYIDGIGIEILGVEIFNNTDKIAQSYGQTSASTTLPYIPDGMDVADENEGKIPANEKEYNRDSKNVTIEVLEDTITNKSLDILITDNNEDYFGWGVDFKIQKKVNSEWKDLKFKSKDVAWIAIAYVPNEDNQIKQKINIEQYYGKLKKGTYRVVKSVYDKGYVDIYSNEFEIK